MLKCSVDSNFEGAAEQRQSGAHKLYQPQSRVQEEGRDGRRRQTEWFVFVKLISISRGAAPQWEAIKLNVKLQLGLN